DLTVTGVQTCALPIYDSSDFVKQQAQKALTTITGQGAGTTGGSTTGGPTTSGGNGGIYVNIGPMSSKAGSPNDAKLQALMVKVEIGRASWGKGVGRGG